MLVMCLQQIANILKNRLQMKNSHKQWLAVLLVQKASRLPYVLGLQLCRSCWTCIADLPTVVANMT